MSSQRKIDSVRRTNRYPTKFAGTNPISNPGTSQHINTAISRPRPRSAAACSWACSKPSILMNMNPAPRIQGLRGELLWELEIAERQLIATADAVPPEKYAWRPNQNTRSVSEILVHVAAGNFMLLDQIGVPPPVDLYNQLPAEGSERLWGMVRRNDELERSIVEKYEVIGMLRRSLAAVSKSLAEATDADLDRPRYFFGEQTTVRRVYLRQLAHTHEHMGQMIAYLKFNGITTPWPDWRPDRRKQP